MLPVPYFFAVGGLWWLVAVIGKMPQALGKLWLLVSMALGVIFVWMMTCVYQIDTVPTWHNGYTTLAFFLTVLLSGPILAAAILRAARVTFNTTPFAIISVLALIACAGVIVLQGLSLACIHSSVQQASALVPDYASLQVWRVVLLCAGLGCWVCPLIRRREPHVAGLILGLILILGGEMIGRVLFYGLHMTVGMAIAG
ncbi:putative dimethyl sulfoxide reductase, anchor subunit [Escherichia coli]|nr:putative dimethyl sulfoxide reductase, anchor subunit [Escherichia coli]